MVHSRRASARLALGAFFWTCTISLSASAQPVPVALKPIEFENASLHVMSPDGTSVTYDPATLETFPTYRMVTKTPWRPEGTVFEGPLLSAILERHGLADLSAIVVVAENDYRIVVERPVWTLSPAMLATRVDGAAHTRSRFGPIQLVVDAADYELYDEIAERHLVWMVARIEPAP